MDEQEKYYPGLRNIVIKYDTLKKRDKILLPLIIAGGILSSLAPPVVIIAALALIYRWGTQWKYSYVICPQCGKYFFSAFSRFFCMPPSFNLRSSSCTCCGLEVSVLPEIGDYS